MVQNFKFHLFKSGAVVAVLVMNTMFATLVTIPSVNAQGFFFKEKKSKPLPKELMALRAAYMMADKSIAPETMKEQLNAELDVAVGNAFWEKNKEGLDEKEKDQKIKTFLSSLTEDELEKARVDAFKSNPQYVPSFDSKVDVRDYEVFKRSNQAAHKKVTEDLKIPAHEVKKGFKSKHFLDEENVPYGGNFFPDNLGGIARRWNNHDFFGDELFDYDTFHEKVQKRVEQATKEQLAKFKEFHPKEYEEFKAECHKGVFYLSDAKKIECYQRIYKNWTEELAKVFVIEDLKKLTNEELHGLSPTEKYDIANGYFDFRTTIYEKYYKGKRRKEHTRNAPWRSTFLFDLYWEGRCNADRTCGICNRHNEPIHRLGVDVDEIGRRIIFEPLDIKALFMSTYFYVEKFAMMGDRTESGKHQRPVNMGAFDALLRGAFTKQNFPFVIDNHPDETVNNVTVIGFDRDVQNVRPIDKKEKTKLMGRLKDASEYLALIKRNASKNTRNNVPKNFGDGIDEENFQNEFEQYKKISTATKVMSVRTTLTLLSEAPMSEANGPTKAKIVKEKKFTIQEVVDYDLYLNDDNEIVEGMFKSGNMDFLWFADGKGTEELQERGNQFIKYETMKDLAIKSSKKEQLLNPGIFPGRK